MYALIVRFQVKPDCLNQFMTESLLDSQGSVGYEPGCLRFDVAQDEKDPNVVYFYEVYRDEAAFQAHTEQPHFFRWRDATKDWSAAPATVYRAWTVYPPNEAWRK